VRSFGLYVQSLKPYTKLLAVVLSVALIGSTLAFGGVAAVNQTSDGDQQQTAYLKGGPRVTGRAAGRCDGEERNGAL